MQLRGRLTACGHSTGLMPDPPRIGPSNPFYEFTNGYKDANGYWRFKDEKGYADKNGKWRHDPAPGYGDQRVTVLRMPARWVPL